MSKATPPKLTAGGPQNDGLGSRVSPGLNHGQFSWYQFG